MPLDRLTEHASRNQEAWAGWAAEYVPNAERNWATDEIAWGILKVPERELQVLPDVAGKDVVELGCGTAYVSAWLARRGARPVGVDLSEEQLATARRMQAEHGIECPLVHASAEDVPLPDASFDLAVSEYGASIWADPNRWISEAARLLRPGGRLVFLRNSPISVVCMALDGITDRLQRPLRSIAQLEWPDTKEVEFHAPHGELLDLLRGNGFEVERLVELYAPDDAKTHEYYGYVTAEWARQWPAEEIWVARKPA